ncbi:hypothetical protein [Pedobacter glucosidilyticus]|uniref:hypothetical protein n=1 Tax=Pedobacter glucosidilyticus TaxID=1122941 RepID=UPI0004034225|nr:hypothetical protein [Pedobacter glucosidilyticus]
MKQFLIFFITLSIFKTLAYAAPVEEEYLGTITVKGVGDYTYKLILLINGEQLTGTSVTNSGNKDEAVVNITGSISQDGAIKFKETSIIKTKIKEDKSIICFVEATLKRKNVDGIDFLEGTFIGRDKRKNICGSGTIRLLKKVSNIQQLSNNFSIANTSTSIERLSNHLVNTIPCTSKMVKVRIFDNGKLDGDELKIIYNNKVISEKLNLNNEGNIFELELGQSSSNVMQIFVLSEGNYPPNTATIEVTSNNQVRVYQLNSLLKTMISIKFELIN